MITNNKVKFVKSLQQKKNRIIHSSFVVESDKDVLELLSSNYEIKELFARKSWIKNTKIRDSFSVNEVSDKELQRMSSLQTSSDVLAIVKIPDRIDIFNFIGVNIVLDNIKDPGNLGTIIRICDWFGVKNIFCSKQTVDVYNSKVVQSTKGSIFRVNVIYTDLHDLINNMKEEINVYAAVMNGIDLDSLSDEKDSLIVFGNESNGISESLLSLINKRITIKKIGSAESLNVAISSAIILNKFCN